MAENKGNETSFWELAEKYRRVEGMSSRTFGEEGDKLKEEKSQIRTQLVSGLASSILETKGEGGEELLESAARTMDVDRGMSRQGRVGLFLEVILKMAELAAEDKDKLQS